MFSAGLHFHRGFASPAVDVFVRDQHVNVQHIFVGVCLTFDVGLFVTFEFPIIKKRVTFHSDRRHDTIDYHFYATRTRTHTHTSLSRDALL